MTPTPAARPKIAQRLFFGIPVLGTIARDIGKSSDTIYYALVILLTLIVLAVKTWGVVALAMTALAMVPVMFTLLILITRG